MYMPCLILCGKRNDDSDRFLIFPDDRLGKDCYGSIQFLDTVLAFRMGEDQAVCQHHIVMMLCLLLYYGIYIILCD